LPLPHGMCLLDVYRALISQTTASQRIGFTSSDNTAPLFFLLTSCPPQPLSAQPVWMAFAAVPAPGGDVSGSDWQDPDGIRQATQPKTSRDLLYTNTIAGVRAFHPRPVHDVCRAAVDDLPVRGLSTAEESNVLPQRPWPQVGRACQWRLTCHAPRL
jgi:hypothetical protein